MNTLPQIIVLPTTYYIWFWKVGNPDPLWIRLRQDRTSFQVILSLQRPSEIWVLAMKELLHFISNETNTVCWHTPATLDHPTRHVDIGWGSIPTLLIGANGHVKDLSVSLRMYMAYVCHGLILIAAIINFYSESTAYVHSHTIWSCDWSSIVSHLFRDLHLAACTGWQSLMSCYDDWLNILCPEMVIYWKCYGYIKDYTDFD